MDEVNFMNSFYKNIACLVWSVPIFIGCTATASKDGGICKRTCGDRPVGGGNIKITNVSSDLSYKCGQAGQIIGHPTFTFFVYEDTSSTSSTASPGVASAVPKAIPKAGIAYKPLTPGYTTETDSSQWCTDSCGFAEITIPVVCADQSLKINIVVPGADYSGAASAGGIGLSVEIPKN
jgi:hypothetical protein